MPDRSRQPIEEDGDDFVPYFSLDEESLRGNGLSLLNPKDAVSSSNLGFFVSTRSIISHADAEAIRRFDAVENALPPDGRYRSIGKGLCAEVFKFGDTGKAIKKLHQKHHRDDLWFDLLMHRATYEAITVAKFSRDLALQVPRVHGYHSKMSSWSSHYGPSFPNYTREPNDVLITDRIVPLTATVRNALINAYCPLARVAEAKANEVNKDCLVRVYLGRRIKTDPKQREWRGLRNFEADLSILTPLIGDEVERHAYSMGVALAYMHFSTKHDARDVEFVLGTGLTDPEFTCQDLQKMERYQSLSTVLNFKQRIVQLWLLDFNQCRPISMDVTGMDSAIGAYFDNDPYYPRAGPTDGEDFDIWWIFRIAYQSAADDLGYGDLGKYFIAKVCHECTRRAMNTPKDPPKAGASTRPMQGSRKGIPSRPRRGVRLASMDELLES